MEKVFEENVSKGMVAVKVDIAYKRAISFEKTSEESARKVFQKLVNANEDYKMPASDAKPLQDYLLFKLLDMAENQARYLSEWLETVPASNFFAFGGDQRTVENTYGQMLMAKQIL